MSSIPEWWKDLGSQKPGPARIRVTFNRPLTAAEAEHMNEVSRLITKYAGDKARFNEGRLYVESHESDSRQLYAAVAKLVENSFVNVFPVAVRTFRELVKPTLPLTNYAKGGRVFGGGVVKSATENLMDTIKYTQATYGNTTNTAATGHTTFEFRAPDKPGDLTIKHLRPPEKPKSFIDSIVDIFKGLGL